MAFTKRFICIRGNWCRDFAAATHPFFNNQQTLEGRDVAPFYVCCQDDNQPAALIFSCCLITHADDSRVSKAISSVCVCLCICPQDKTKTAESIITKLGTGVVHQGSLPTS